MNSELQILIAGCGSAGSRHARNLSAAGVKNIYLFDPDSQRSATLASEIDGMAVESVESRLSEGCDGVVVATPPVDHISTAAIAVEAGAHVMVEKPLSVSMDGVEAFLDKAERSGLTVMAAYNLRFLPALVELKRMIDAGKFGRVMAVHAEFGQYLPTWRPQSDYRNNYITSAESGGGIILEESHEFDYVSWLAGPVESVYCAADKLSDLEMDAEDTAFATMKHTTGVISTIRVDCTQHGYKRGARVIGTEATADWDYFRGLEIARSDGEKSLDDTQSDVSKTYIEEIETFIRCLEGEGVPPVDGRAALRVLETTLAAKKSARTGKEVAL